MTTWAIILAAGSGNRMGKPKALLPLHGKPMLFYSLEAFEKSSHIDAIGLVCRREDVEAIRSETKFIAKVRFVVPGGKERQDSVFEGVKALPKDADLAAVHDSARPLVSVAQIDAVLEAAKQKGAALIAVPTKDTVKLSHNGVVKETLKREWLWSAQTPQAFHVDLFKKALEKAKEDGFYGTDCAGLVERLGVPVHIVEGSPENIKITSPSDISMAEAWLAQQRRWGQSPKREQSPTDK